MKKTKLKAAAMCLAGIMALCGFGNVSVKAEETFPSVMEADNSIMPLAGTESIALPHEFFVRMRNAEKTPILGNYQTTYWVYGGATGASPIFYKEPTNSIIKLDTNANFLNGQNVGMSNGVYSYTGDVYYKNVYKGNVLFTTTMTSTGRYSFSEDPELFII